MKKNFKIFLSAPVRFHFFDLARELENKNYLYKLSTYYPFFYFKNFNFDQSKIINLNIPGFLLLFINWKFSKYLSYKQKYVFDKFFHHSFDKFVARSIKNDVNFFIGLSTYSLQSIKISNQLGIKSIIDHSSLHYKSEYEAHQIESERWGLKNYKKIGLNWRIKTLNDELEFADYIVSPSKLAMNSLVKNGANPKKIFINHLGVDLSKFYAKEKKQISRFRIVYAGGVNYAKGVLILLEAFSTINLSDVELLIIGNKNRDKKFLQLFDKLLTKNVNYLPAVSQAELCNHFNNSDVFVSPSISDGFGMIVPQAMACALPIIVSSNVGAKEIINEGKNGFIVPVHNSKKLAEKIKFLYENRDIAKSMGEYAKQTIKENYSWKKYFDNYEKILTEIS